MQGALRHVRSLLPAFLTVVAILVVWQVLEPLARIPSFILPLPSAVLSLLLSSKVHWDYHTFITVSEALLGFSTATVFGIAIAIGIASSNTLRGIVEPLIVALQVVPKIAFIPVLFLWFGLGAIPRIVAVFLVCFFPIVVSATAGFATVDKDLVDLVRTFSQSRLLILRKILFPSALPSIFAGLKIAIVLAPVGAIIAEFISSQAGLGFLILSGQTQLNTTLVFAAAFVLVLASFCLYGAVLIAERLLIPWSR
jgi:NitT/TauT family transport system permease protein